MEQTELPAGWRWTTIGEIASVNRRNPNLRSLPDDLPVTFLPMAGVDAESGTVANPETKLLGVVRKGFTPFAPGDVLFAKITPSMENGKAAIAGPLGNNIGFGSTEFHVITPGPLVTAKWIFHFIRQESFRADAKANFSGTAGQLRVPSDFVCSYCIPLPPLPEQQAIVAAIETQFTRLDAAIAALKRVQTNLRRYRAAVLKTACEGRLVPTEAALARAEGRDYEPAAALLARVLAERRGRWEADHPGKKYKEPAGPEVDELPELPEGWCWATVEQLGDVSGGLTKNSRRDQLHLKLPYLRVANVYANRLELDDVETIGVNKQEVSRVLLEEGDLLIVEGNGSPDQIGRVAIWNGSIPECLHQNHLIKVRFADKRLAYHVLYWLLSRPGRDYIRLVASSTSGLYTLSLSKVANLPVPLAPREEQERIVTEIERRLSMIEPTEDEMQGSLARAARLRQSILQRAFRGELVAESRPL